MPQNEDKLKFIVLAIIIAFFLAVLTTAKF